jgi:hypothetical protein
MPLNASLRARRVVEINPITLTPTRTSESYRSIDKVVPRFAEEYVFIDRDGIYVPSRIVGEKIDSRTRGKRRVSGWDTYEVNFRWLLVNSDCPESLFDHQLLNDSNQLVELVSEKLLTDVSD